MTLVTDFAQLSYQDLQRYRTQRARMNAITLAPQHYSRDEIEEAHRNEYALWAEFIERYELPASDAELVIDPNTGRCWSNA